MPVIYNGGDSLPPRIEPRYFGQDWTNSESLAENYGATLHMVLSKHWSAAGGVFRSVSNTPASYADLYIDAQPTGSADHQIVSFPDQRSESTSGEARLTGIFPKGSWQHTVVFAVRGRNVEALYNGADVIDFGSSVVGQTDALPRPNFIYGPISFTARLRETRIL
jgi:iron complex outermembrane recepter protein